MSDRSLVLAVSTAAAPVIALVLWALGQSSFVVVLVPVAAFVIGVLAADRDTLPSLLLELLAFAAGLLPWGLALAVDADVDGAGAIGTAVFVLMMAAACTAAWAWGLWIRGRSVTST